MSNFLKKTIVMIIVIIIGIFIKNISYSTVNYGAPTLCKKTNHGYSTARGRANCLKYGNSSIHIRKYPGTIITKFIDWYPSLSHTAGYLCLQHHRDSSDGIGENSEINERIYVEGVDYWVQDGWDMDTYTSIKKDEYYSGRSKTIAKMAYIMSCATEENAASGEQKRKDSGVQGALWSYSKSFYYLNVNGDYDDYFDQYASRDRHPGWYENSGPIIDMAKQNADKAANFFVAKDTTKKANVDWSESGNYYIIGPFSIKFPDSSTSMELSNSKNDSVNYTILNSNKQRTNQIFSENEFYIKVKKSDFPR